MPPTCPVRSQLSPHPVVTDSREDSLPMFKPTTTRGCVPALGAVLLVTLTTGAFAATAPAKAPGPGLRWQWTPATLQLAGTRALKEADAKLARIVAIPDAKRTFQNTVRAMESVESGVNETLS